jgi:hypothetical protein
MSGHFDDDERGQVPPVQPAPPASPAPAEPEKIQIGPLDV